MKEHNKNGAEDEGMNNNSDITHEGKLYDTSFIESISDSSEFFNQMIVLFVDTVIKDFNILKAEAAKNNWKQAGLIAHNFKSTFGNFKVNSVLPYAKELEKGTSEPFTVLKKLEDNLLKVLIQIKSDYKHLF